MIKTWNALAVVVAALGLLVGALPAEAGVSPLGFGIVAPVQLPPRDFTVFGARLSAGLGRNQNVYGIDLGAIGNMTDGNFVGVAASGLFNWNRGMATVLGLQLAAGANINANKARIIGLQVAAWNANLSESTHVGLGLGVGNHSPHSRLVGVQLGLYNRARDVYGFQFGLFNFAENLHGIQVGLLNFNSKGLFAIAPILNIGF